MQKYIGVTNKGSRWRAAITLGQKSVGVGTFTDAKKAALAYDAAARRRDGERAKLNFPDTVVPDSTIEEWKYEGKPSRHPGVHYVQYYQKWVAKVQHKGKLLVCRTFHTQEEAIEAVKQARQSLKAGEPRPAKPQTQTQREIVICFGGQHVCYADA